MLFNLALIPENLETPELFLYINLGQVPGGSKPCYIYLVGWRNLILETPEKSRCRGGDT
jgi:hypothetical protein